MLGLFSLQQLRILPDHLQQQAKGRQKQAGSRSHQDNPPLRFWYSKLGSLFVMSPLYTVKKRREE